MIRQALEARLGIKLSDESFKEIMQAVTDDIRVNRIYFNKKTSYKGMLIIAHQYSNLYF